MTTLIEWHDATKELPPRSVESVLVRSCGCYITSIGYSHRHKAFNSSDKYTDVESEMVAFSVDLWAYNPFCEATP